MVWIHFIACTSVIVVAGTKLSRYDIIAEKAGLGRTWIGVISWPR
jgi:cation:H+ antiporter